MPPLSTDLENLRPVLGSLAGQARTLENALELERAKNAAAEKTIALLEAELAGLKPKTFLWSDDFAELPRDELGQYIYQGEGDPRSRFSVGPLGLVARLTAGEGHIRSEIGRRAESGARVVMPEPFRAVRWYALGVNLSPDFPAIAHKVVAMQFWPVPDAGEESLGRNPILSLEILRERIRFVQVVSTDPVQTGQGERRELWSGEKVLGKPFRVVLRAVWRPDAQGELEGWVNGVPVFTVKGEPSANADAIGPRFRWGLYCPALRPGEVPPEKAIPAGTRFAAAFTRLRVGDETNKLGDFA